jgi:hypothetical protein
MVQYKNDKPNYQIRSYRFQNDGNKYKIVIDTPLVMHGVYPMLFLGSHEAAYKTFFARPGATPATYFLLTTISQSSNKKLRKLKSYSSSLCISNTYLLDSTECFNH